VGGKGRTCSCDYYNGNSPYVQYMKTVFNNNISKLKADPISTNIGSSLVETICLLKSSFTMYKQVCGEYEHGGMHFENYCFYDEREWRYLLPVDSSSPAYLQAENPCQAFIDIYNGVQRNGEWRPGRYELNNQIEFTYDDINFVIVPNACDKENIIKKLTASPNDIEIIRGKITTLESLIAQVK